MKATWNFVKSATGRNSSNCIHLLNIEGKQCNNHINAYFSTIADEMVANSASDNNGSSKNNNCLNYLFQTLKYPFPNINFNYTYTKEI
jgi:hypothetical protein